MSGLALALVLSSSCVGALVRPLQQACFVMMMLGEASSVRVPNIAVRRGAEGVGRGIAKGVGERANRKH